MVWEADGRTYLCFHGVALITSAALGVYGAHGGRGACNQGEVYHAVYQDQEETGLAGEHSKY